MTPSRDDVLDLPARLDLLQRPDDLFLGELALPHPSSTVSRGLASEPSSSRGEVKLHEGAGEQPHDKPMQPTEERKAVTCIIRNVDAILNIDRLQHGQEVVDSGKCTQVPHSHMKTGSVIGDLGSSAITIRLTKAGGSSCLGRQGSSQGRSGHGIARS